MNKYILFNESGKLVTRFVEGTHTVEQCSQAVQVSETVFYASINEQDGIWVYENGEVLKKPLPAPTLNELKFAKKTEITQSFNASMSQVVGDTSSYEISSWGKQEAEARSFANAATTLNPTPLIDNLASARGIPKALLASKIIQKADLYSSYSGQLIGKRQGLEDAIDAATSKAGVAAISW